MKLIAIILFLLTFTLACSQKAPQFTFRTEIIARDVEGAYLTKIADINGDTLPDVVLLSIRSSDIFWYENPTWERHLFARGIAPAAVGAAVDNFSRKTIAVLLTGFHRDAYDKNKGELVFIDKGEAAVFAREPAAHRAAFADIDGDGLRELVVAPISGPGPDAPINSLADTPLVLYRPPHPKRFIITPSLKGTVHGLTIIDWDENGRDDIITAGFGGVWLHQSTGGEDGDLSSLGWRHRKLTSGRASDDPRLAGAGDIRIGKGANSARFIATIEGVHGGEIAVYEQTVTQEWRRRQIGGGYKQLHGFDVADLNNDGRDEIIVSDSQDGGVFIYYADIESDTGWSRFTLDEYDMSAGACDAVDITGDGLKDIICAGLQTKNAILYVNTGNAK